jgi:hypothetical protein
MLQSTERSLEIVRMATPAGPMPPARLQAQSDLWDYCARHHPREVFAMWAQMITSQLKPGKDDELVTLTAQLKAAEQPGSGLVHATAVRDSKDPGRVIMFVVF